MTNGLFQLKRLDMAPFGRRLSRFMIFHEPDGDGQNAPGLYVYLTADVTMSMRKRGLLQLLPLYNGEELPYTFSATPAALTISTARGDIELAIDAPDILRVRARGVGLRALSPMGRMEIPVEMNDGTFELSYSSALGNLLFKPITGAMSFNSVWHIKDWRADDVVVDLTPDDTGILEVAIHEFNHAGAALPAYRPFDECAAESAGDFYAWQKKYKAPSAELRDLFDEATYITWICAQQPRINGIASALGGVAIYNRRYGLDRLEVSQQALVALAFDDDAATRDAVASVLRLRAPDGMLPAWANDQDRQYGLAAPPSVILAAKTLDGTPELYDGLADIASWWLKWRDSDGDGVPEYAYAGEPGFDAGLRISGSRAVESPDLSAYLALIADFLSASGRADAPKWRDVAVGLLSKLYTFLWGGESFFARRSTTHEPVETSAILGFLPAILGGLLPDEIAEKLTASLGALRPWEHTRETPLWALLIPGLRELGRADLAEQIRDRLVAHVREHGFVNAPGEKAYASRCASAFLYAVK